MTPNSEGLVIGPDGTLYYSRAGGVGRMRPGMAREDNWVNVASSIWGLALDGPNQRLYVGSPSANAIYAINLADATPRAQRIASVPAPGGPNGLTIGPDGTLWFTAFSGNHVFRLVFGEMPQQVTTSNISGANGLAFGPDGALYVDSYSGGVVIRLTLENNMESGRTTIRAMGASLGSPDGLAFDARGRLYVTDNGGGTLVRMDADGSNAVVLSRGMSRPASIEFGVGALPCTDIYIATGRGLVRYEMGDTPGADVPWHR